MKKKIFCVLTSCLLAFSAAACSGDNKDDYKDIDYTPAHTSTTRFVNFASSDSGLDAFLNEYTERHMRDSGIAVGSQKVGQSTRTAWREWDTMIGSWWDASSANGAMSYAGATNDQVNDWLKTIRIDRTGYVWCDNDASIGSWGMGWAFPDYTKGGKGWVFDKQSDFDAWTLSDPEKYTASLKSSCYVVNAKSRVDKIELTSTFDLSTRVSPMLRLGFGWTPNSGSGAVEELYIYYTTDDEPEFSEDKKVSFSEYCLNGFAIERNKVMRANYYFPMYLQEKWGNFYDYESGSAAPRQIEKIKIVLKAKTTFTGTLSIDFVTSEFDDRQIINPCNYIIAAKNNTEFTRDKALVSAFLPRARAAMNFLLNQGNGTTGLISTEYLVGHLNNGRHETGTGIGNGYWDVDAFPNVNLYCNTSYYNALTSMAYLENLAKTLGVAEYDESVTTVGKDMKTPCVYTKETAESLSALAETCKERIQTEFWNEETGRFHVGYYDNFDEEVQDHGYTMFNQQVITSGIATPEQTKSILDWINGNRTVKGDNSTGADIYKYEIAPRFNTHNIGNDFLWLYGVSFDGNVQNGGTALHLSYYDVTSQSYISADSSFAKLKKLQAWYEKVKAAGGEGMQFYREYYKNTDIKLQGNGNGLVGVDVEFLEAALLFTAVPDSYFGLDTNYDGTLCFTPNIPDGIDWWRMENLVYDGHYYDVTAGKNCLWLSGTCDYSTGSGSPDTKVQVTFRKPKGKYNVLVNGTVSNSYRENGENVVVTVPFGDVKVQIKLK